MKLTKKYFCEVYPEMATLRRRDPIQFNVLYNEWYNIRVSKKY